MSKNHSIPRNQLFQFELISICVIVAGIVGFVVWKSSIMLKPAPPVPPANMQLIQLQGAVNLINP